MNPLKNLIKPAKFSKKPSKKKFEEGGEQRSKLAPGGTNTVQNYQRWLNKTFNAGLEDDGAWGPITQQAYERFVLSPRKEASKPSAPMGPFPYKPFSLADAMAGRVNSAPVRSPFANPPSPQIDSPWIRKAEADTQRSMQAKKIAGFLQSNPPPLELDSNKYSSEYKPKEKTTPKLGTKSLSDILNVPSPDNIPLGSFTEYLENSAKNYQASQKTPQPRDYYVDKSIIAGQDKRQASGFYSKQNWENRGVLNRSYDNRLYDTDKKLFDLINNGKINSKDLVYIDIGSGLGSEKGNVNQNPGPTIKDLLTREKLPKDFTIYATDLPEEVADFTSNPHNYKLLQVGKGRLKVQPIDGFDPDLGFVKNSSKNTVFLRAANSVDKLMDKNTAQKHFEKVANQLFGKEVYYMYHNYLLYKPKGDNYFTVVEKINPSGFSGNTVYVPKKTDFY